MAANPNPAVFDAGPLGKITVDGVFLEELETNPAQYLPEIDEKTLGPDHPLTKATYEALDALRPNK